MLSFEKSVTAKGSLLCVGIDPPLQPRPDRRIHKILRQGDLREIARHSKSVMKQTGPYAAAFKTNLAFFIARGAKGIDLLLRCREWCGDTPLILDAKFNDIGNTLEGYAAFSASLGVAAVTASPYMGDDFSAFTRRGIGVFVLDCGKLKRGFDSIAPTPHSANFLDPSATHQNFTRLQLPKTFACHRIR